MELFQAPNGSIQQLELVGTSKKSTLTGTVRRGPRPGRTAYAADHGGGGRPHSPQTSGVHRAQVGFFRDRGKGEPLVRIVRPDSETPGPSRSDAIGGRLPQADGTSSLQMKLALSEDMRLNLTTSAIMGYHRISDRVILDALPSLQQDVAKAR